MIHKTTRSILSVLLAALLLVTSTPLTPAFAGEGAVSLQSESGEGRVLKQVNGEYQIGSAEDLREFADKVNNGQIRADADAVLTDDINLNPNMDISEDGTVTTGNPDQWTPIGSDSNSYRGTFDGNGKTISGLYIDSSSANDQGLFGYVGTGGKVQNLSVTGSVSGGEDVGGIVGNNFSGTVTNCAFSGSVSGNIGVGGVVGENLGTSTVENCYNTGKVTGNRVGGVVGENSDGSVTNSYNTGTVTGTDDRVGGVVGENSDGSVTNCYNTGKVSGSEYVGGVVGDNSGSSIVENCYFLQQNDVPAQGIGSGEEFGATAESVNDLDALCEEFANVTNTWIISGILGRPVLQENPEGGLGSPESPYQISTATQLKNFATAVNGDEKSAHAKLMNNIDLSSVCGESNSWPPIGNSSSNSYEGTFDGDGHTISGLYINSSSDNNQGLFGYVGSEGTVQNLSVSGSVKGDWYVGGVVGYNNGGTVTGCIFSGSGSVSGNRYVGGVVGYNSSGTVTNCAFSGTVTGIYVGGVVGGETAAATAALKNAITPAASTAASTLSAASWGKTAAAAPSKTATTPARSQAALLAATSAALWG